MTRSRSMLRPAIEADYDAKRSTVFLRQQYHHAFSLALLVLCGSVVPSFGWGSSSGRYEGDYLYSQSGASQWLYNSASLAITVQGCVWGYTYDNEEAGCLEDSSEDGTYYWYQMANCRRAQVAYTVYGSDSSSSASCSANTFLQSFVTKNGLAEFIELVEDYDENAVISDEDLDDDDVPEDCEEGDNGYYLALGCSSSGGFTIDQFSDQYCQNYVGTYQSLSNLDTTMGYMDCHQVYSSSSGNSAYKSLIGKLLPYSESCSPTDYALCADVDGTKTSGLKKSGGGSFHSHASNSGPGMSLASKVKYTIGSAFLLSSFVMFLGILSTNRRKRRAMVQKKFRQTSTKSYDEEARQRKSRSSRSRSRGGAEKPRSRSRSRRSKSRSRREREGGTFA